MADQYGRVPARSGALVTQMLTEMADKLERVRPDEPITTIGRTALLQATTLDPALLPLLREATPDITGQVIRREYAAQLRQIAGQQ
ncbi:hypothetical protein ABZ733_08365 [Streptomyces longwoodensis]|uniref:hypothetical protein n=1 Tax=Streptomyces longwoodensis TaxID=68231 RepID=UPI00340AB70E